MRPLNEEQRHRKAATVEDSIYDAIRHADSATNLLDLLYSDERKPSWGEICKHLEYAEQQLAAATVIVQAALKAAKSLRDR
nr:MAG TPA: hypothetical protein [Caudoviricetes sp.]